MRGAISTSSNDRDKKIKSKAKIPPMPEYIKKPCIDKCDKKAIEKELKNVKEKIEGMKKGKIPSGMIIEGSEVKGGVLDAATGLIYQSKLNFEPYIAPEIKRGDPCILYCTIEHEWVHYNDKRIYNINWSMQELTIYLELPAYKREQECLENYLKD